MISYGFLKEIDGPLETAIALVTTALQTEGFGILTRIDIHKKLKEKLDVDFQQYVILGACNPRNAFKALKAEENIGLLLPCNVIIYEKDNRFFVGIIRPSIAMGMIENEMLKEIASNVETGLEKVFNQL